MSAVGTDGHHAHLAFVRQLAHLEVAAVDVAGAMARLAVARKLDRTAVVDADRGRLLRQAHVAQQVAEVLHLAGARRCRDDLGLSRVRDRDSA